MDNFYFNLNKELQLLKLSDLKIFSKTNPSFPIINGFINKKEFMILNGASKTGKSLFAINLGLAVSSGDNFLGMNTSKSKVIYLQTEIAHDFLLERLTKMLVPFPNFKEEMFLTSFDRIRLDDSDSFNSLEQAIENEKPDLLILDPFYELHSKNEQNANEMTPILASLRRLARKHDLGIILIHHQGKNSENKGNTKMVHQSRGSSAFGDVPDCLVSLNKSDDHIRLSGIFRNRPNLNIDYSINSETLNINSFKNLEQLYPQKKESHIDAIKRLITSSPEPLNRELLKQSIHCDPSTINKHLSSLLMQGLIIEKNGYFFKA